MSPTDSSPPRSAFRRGPAKLPRVFGSAWLLLAAGLGACDVTRAREPAPVDDPIRGSPVATPARPGAAALGDPEFASLIARLSEPGGYFDTDNLISNERSYLHVAQDLRALRRPGVAYVGVGPDQSFSYIAALRPEAAFIIDIRRDNLLLHLLFKATFHAASDRMEYLALLFGRPVPAEPLARDADVQRLVNWLDRTPGTVASAAAALGRIQAELERSAVPLSEEDRERIDGFHREFIRAGPDLRFASHGRRPSAAYPTYRELLLERDRSGRHASFLASHEDFAFVKALQEAHRVVPVVGDLAGTHALEAIGREAERRGLVVGALYVSNVEFYLLGDGLFDRFAATVAGLPADSASVLVRSWFNRGPTTHPASVPGSLSTQLIQPLDEFTAGWREGRWRSFGSLVQASRGSILEEAGAGR